MESLKKFSMGLLAATALLTGCGKEEFRVAEATLEQTSPGFAVVPPKVDILFAQDDSGSTFESLDAINQQTRGFLNGLESKGWDFHFGVSPLTQAQNITQALASRYDLNWGSLWKEPFPGASPHASDRLSPSLFRFPEAFTGFITAGQITGSNGSYEPGLQNIVNTLVYEKNTAATRKFLRSDALLAIIVLSNGDDTSGISNYYAERDQGLSTFEAQLKALKPSASQVKLYAEVAARKTTDCRGATVLVEGYRYSQIASRTGGLTFDACTTPLASALDQIGNHLQAQKLAIRVRYLLLKDEPNPDTLRITKFPNGDTSRGVEIPQDATNGWTYIGYRENIHTVDSPALLNRGSGYAIELHGSAKLIGNDTASIAFKPAGARDSAGQ